MSAEAISILVVVAIGVAMIAAAIAWGNHLLNRPSRHGAAEFANAHGWHEVASPEHALPRRFGFAPFVRARGESPMAGFAFEKQAVSGLSRGAISATAGEVQLAQDIGGAKPLDDRYAFVALRVPGLSEARVVVSPADGMLSRGRFEALVARGRPSARVLPGRVCFADDERALDGLVAGAAGDLLAEPKAERLEIALWGGAVVVVDAGGFYFNIGLPELVERALTVLEGLPSELVDPAVRDSIDFDGLREALLAGTGQAPSELAEARRLGVG